MYYSISLQKDTLWSGLAQLKVATKGHFTKVYSIKGVDLKIFKSPRPP